MAACVLCGKDGVERLAYDNSDLRRDIHRFSCRRCGVYSMQFLAEVNAKSVDARTKLFVSTATRQAFEFGSPLLLDADDFDRIAEERERTTIPENVDKLLTYIRMKCPRPGQRVKIERDDDYTIIDATGIAELDFIANYAVEEGYARHDPPVSYWLTPKGWERISARPTGFIPGHCFVAMAFRDSLKPAYTEGIQKAMEDDCGFRAVRMLELEHNDKICDRIIVEIRRAQFVVADFTFQRAGVYFEAGFAAALGRPVIWTCKACHFQRLHFDTRQYNHIKWEHPVDLRSQLATRIRSTIPGARPA